MTSDIRFSKDSLQSFAEMVRADIDMHLKPVIEAAESALVSGDMDPIALGNDELHEQARLVGLDIDRKLIMSTQYLKDLVDGMTFMATFAELVGMDLSAQDGENGNELKEPGDYAMQAREAIDFKALPWF